MAEYEVQWVAEGEEEIGPSVVVGNHRYPARIVMVARAADGSPDVQMVFKIRNGVPEAVDVRLTAKPAGRPVRSSDFNHWNLKNWALKAFQLHSYPRDAEDVYGPRDWATGSQEEWNVVKREMDGAVSKQRRPTTAELRTVAQIYRDAMVGPDGKRGKPTEAVQMLLGTSRRTAARRIEQARAAGLLPQTEQGKVNG